MAREKRKQSTKRRRLILDERDEIAFTRILREKYPNIGFIQQSPASPSECTVQKWYSNCQSIGLVDAFVPDGENWHLKIPPLSKTGEYNLKLPKRTFTLWRSHWLWALCEGQWSKDQPTLESGGISGAYHPDAESDVKSFLDSVWRLTEKITVKIDGIWCGFSAVNWAAEHPERTLNRTARPPQGWVSPPNCRYYQDELWDDNPPKNHRLMPMYLYSSE